MSLREQDKILDAIEYCATELQLSRLPTILVSDHNEAEKSNNAFTGHRHIIISKDLLSKRSGTKGDVLRGVLSHELAHWYYADMMGSSLARGFGWPLFFSFDFCVRMTQPMSPLAYLPGNFGQAATGLFAIAARINNLPIRLFIRPALMADGRMEEYSCDQAAVIVGEDAREGLIAWLEDRSFSEGAPSGWEQVRSLSHPPSELRIEALESPEEMAQHSSLTEERFAPHVQVTPEHVGLKEKIWG